MSSMKRFSNWFLPVFVLLVMGTVSPNTGFATITSSGDNTPFPWSQYTRTAIGGHYGTGIGSVTVNGGDALTSGEGVISNNINCSGTMTVEEAGSTWNISNGNLYIGYMAYGKLAIANGGYVSVDSGATHVGYSDVWGTSIGTIDFGGTGGTLSTQGLYLSTNSQLTGAGTIVTHGLVSDTSLTFNSTPSLNQTFNMGSVAVTLDMSNSDNVGDLGVGNTNDATLEISGVTVHSAHGYVGYQAGSSGTATVDGSNSTWASSAEFRIGNHGDGTLKIINGGSVTVANMASLGYNLNSSGIAFVDGTGSTWTSAALDVGGIGEGVLNITNGGSVHSTGGYLGHHASFAAGTVTVADAGSVWTNTGDLYVGDKGNGQLNISGGGSVTVSGATYVGNSFSSLASLNFSTGTLTTQSLYVAGDIYTVTGTGTINTNGLVSDKNLIFDGSDLTNHGLSQTLTMDHVDVHLDMGDSNNVGDLGVGVWDSASLTIRNGITVWSKTGCLGFQTDYSTGVATVDTASTWNNSEDLHIGYRGDGTLNIQNGSLVTVAGTTYIGSLSETGIGTVAFGGSGGTLSTQNLYILAPKSQFSGTGSIDAHNFTGDIDLTFNGSNIATPTLGGSVVLNLDMSDSANPGNLGIGYSSGATSTLTIQGNTTVYSGVTCLAQKNGSSATATVTGNGAIWANSGVLYFGGPNALLASGGTATLNIINGGMLSVASIAKGYGLMGGGPNGTIYFDNGILQARISTTSFMRNLTNVFVKAGGAIIDTNGYNITIGQMLKTDGTSTGGGLTKIGAGALTLSGANTYTGQTVVEAGTLTLVGANTATPSAWDPVLDLGGADIQNGKLVFDYVGSLFQPGTSPATTVRSLLDDSYGTGGSMDPWTTGQFQCSNADGNHGLGWIDDTVNKRVTVMYTLYGDSNLDGSVNGTDLNAVLSYYNQSDEVWASGDFNYDGSVNGTDLNTVLSNYNQSLSSSTAAVPEPSTILLMVLGLLGLLAWRKRFEIG